MKKINAFHGSDLEKIQEIYHINKHDIVQFGANVNPLGLSETLKQDLSEHLDIITSYPDRDYVDLKKSIAAYCNTKAENIIVGNGSTELISLLISQKNAKKALVLGPTYSEYERELSLNHGTIEFYNLSKENEFRLDIECFERELRNDIDLLIICNPNNPTSSALTTEQMEEIILLCRKHDIFVMVDETYAEFAPDISAITSIPLTEYHENLMVIRGVSKFYAAPGLRFGYGITTNKDFLSMILTHQNPWSVNSIAAFAGERMLRDQEYYKKTRDLILSERTRMISELNKLNSYKVYPAYANFILVEILKEGISSFQVFEAAIRKKLMIRDCSSFESLGGEFVRFCIMHPEDNDKLLEVFKELN